jgi:ATP-dependent DNA helicase RecG
MARKLETIGVVAAADLARVYPRTYKDWRVPTPIERIYREAAERARGGGDEEAFEEILVGEIVKVQAFHSRMAILQAQVRDDTGMIRVTWFGRKGLKFTPGDRVFLCGRIGSKRKARKFDLEMNVLQHRVLREGETYRGAIVPVYRANKELSSRAIATLIERNLDSLSRYVQEIVPAEIIARHGYVSLRQAWREMHQPVTLESAAAARERLIYEEFFQIALVAASKRAQRAVLGGAVILCAVDALLDTFEGSLPFVLTSAQRRVIEQIHHDMALDVPMNRLLQGDVGCGKTVVAAGAITLAARLRVQSALMAPTEILAAQHSAKLAPLLLPFGITVEALFGSMGARERREVEGRVASGEALLVVGTHALLTEAVAFKNLGLVIIDEQHRFGVAQRAQLRAKGHAVHTLSMTATPIPRTLAQTKYADFDLSVIDELPPGRTPVDTRVIREGRKFRAYEFVRKNVALGRQAYVVAPAIGDIVQPAVALTSAIRELETLRSETFPDLRVELLHGRMLAREKNAIMRRFSRGEIDVLLATTVIEVGVDVPNASVMVVLDAHRYGLAQLHQLRGRVGRGVERSYCILVAPDDRLFVERLEILARTNDGFMIAEEDMRLRGTGELDGTAQAGTASALLGDVVTDFALYMRAKVDADALVQSDPFLERSEHDHLRALLDEKGTPRAALVSS